MVTAKWNHENEEFNFVKYFENMLIQVSSIWIAEKSGSIFVHFCPTFRISLVLQLSFESSKICEIENQSERNVLNIHRTFEQFFSPKITNFINGEHLKRLTELLESEERYISYQNSFSKHLFAALRKHQKRKYWSRHKYLAPESPHTRDR